MSIIFPIDEADRRLPAGEEIFLDHVAHFVPDVEAARAALVRAGFAPTPVSIQVNPDPAGGPPQPTGTGNITCMLEHGYLEVLFRTADTPLGREFDAALARYAGLHLAAFAVADAAATHARLADAGFRMQPLVDMRRPVATEAGEDVAAFSVVRLMPGEMPEGRIQALTHRTPDTVWQPRWLTHPQRRPRADRYRDRRGRSARSRRPLRPLPLPRARGHALRTGISARSRRRAACDPGSARGTSAAARRSGAAVHGGLRLGGRIARPG